MNLFASRRTSSMAALGAIGAVLWGAYAAIRPEPQVLTPERREAAEAATEEVLRTCPRPVGDIVKLAVAPLAGDFTGEVAQGIRDALSAEGFYDLAPPSLVQRVQENLLSERPETEGLDEARAIGEGAGAEWVLWGRVNRLSSVEGHAAADMELAINDVDSAEGIWAETVQWDSAGAAGPGRTASGAGLRGPLSRLAGCVVFALCLPLAVLPWVRRVLGRESNAATLALLASLTAVDVLIALMILRGSLSTFLYVASIGTFAIVAGWYNFLVCDRIDAGR
jgi:hypothetical protein